MPPVGAGGFLPLEIGEYMDILLALLPALGWGVSPLIISKIGGNPHTQILGTGLGALLIGIISLLFVMPGELGMYSFWIAFGSGVFWVIAQIGQYKAMEMIGVSKTMPLSTGLQLAGASILSVIILGEWPLMQEKLVGLIAVVIMIVGAYLTSHTSEKTAESKSTLEKGIILLFVTGLGYIVFSLVPRLINESGSEIFLPQMLGIAVAAIIVSAIKHPRAFVRKESYQSIIVGSIWAASAGAYIVSAKLNGVAVAFIITQLSVVVSTLGGIFVLKENKTSREMQATITGLVCIILGSVMTAFI